MLPLLLHRGVVQITAHGQIGQGIFPVVEGHNGLADAHVAAVELKSPLSGVVAYLALVAGDAALVAFGQVVDGPAEGGMAPEQVDVPDRKSVV